MQHLKFISVLMALCIMLSACTTMQPVTEIATTDQIEKEIKPGNQVRLVTKTGNEHFIIVSSISEGYIFGEEESFKLDDIEIIEVKRPTAVGQAGGITAAFTVGAVIAFLTYAIFTSLLLGVAL
jgi:hypothetical protein